MKIIPIILAVATLVIGSVVFLSVGGKAIVYGSDTEVREGAESSEEHSEEIVVPAAMTLQIPVLNIDADIEFVGINEKGNMASPAKYEDVAWYKHGPVPGEIGSAVIAGHLDNGLGLRGVFEDLSNLKKGDDVYVNKINGERLHFVVAEIVTYPYKEVPTELLFNQADDERLNLVTCVGKWLSKEKTYSERLIVYTTLVGNSLSSDISL